MLSINFRWVFMRMRSVFLFFIISICLSNVQGSDNIPKNELVYLYKLGCNTKNIEKVTEQLKAGNFVKQLDPNLFKPSTSVWIYIPKEVLLNDTTRPYLLTG